jgi:glycosyltransferase involved in cell wall biosynthesis
MELNLQGKTLGIIEEGLCGLTAHWYEWVRAVKLMNEERGVRVRIAGNKAIDPRVAVALGAEPVLAQNSWDASFNRGHRLARYSRILSHNFRFYRSCAALLKRWGPMDCIQLPFVRIHHLIGGLTLTRRYGRRGFRRLVMQVNMPAGRHTKGSSRPVFKPTSLLMKHVLKAFGPYIAQGVVCLGSDSDQTARDYETLSGVPFVVFPTPCVTPYRTGVPNRHVPDAPVLFTCLGPSRHEKGSDILLAAVKEYLRTPGLPRARFVVQWIDNFSDDAGRIVTPDPYLLQHPDVELIGCALSSDEYDKKLLASDCIVMPYRWEAYFCRGSALVVEAATAGIPVLCTEDTWLERAMRRYGAGMAVRDGDASHLVKQLAEMARGIDEFQTAAREKAPIARQVNSPESFLRCLWGNGPN